MPPTAEPTAVADHTVDRAPAGGQRRGRRVALLATGGTIASAATPDGAGRRAALSPAELLDAIGPLGGVSVEPVVELARVNSWDVGPQLMWSIASRVRELAARDDVDGVVVTHGTDTIEETAFVADIATSTDTPVVFVAAMRASDEPSPDGPRNLRTALLAASGTAVAGQGVTVCLDDELHAARWVRKVHSHRLHALASPGGTPLATATPGDRLVRSPVRDLRRWSVSWPTHEVTAEVPLLTAYAGLSPHLVRTVLERTGARGLVLEGVGLGHVPAAVGGVLADAVEQGVVVVVATRVLSGGTWPVYGGAGGGVELSRSGTCDAGSLSAGKARLLLMACLAGADADAARTRFRVAVDVLGRAEGAGAA